MDTLTYGLNMRFELVSKSFSERDFYLNLHQYFDHIQKTEPLKNILDNAEREYHISFRSIWGKYRQYTEEELDEKSAQVKKLERFSLYALGCGILMRIYYPIEYYKGEKEPDPRPDPLALLLVHGFNYTLRLNLWDKEYLKSTNTWYDGKRGMYESELRRFHISFLDELAKPLPPAPIVKPDLSFDKVKSILKIGDSEINITLKSDKPVAHYVLEYIFENEEGLQSQSFYSDIRETKFQKEKKSNKTVYDACNNINKKVSDQAKISNFLIVKSGKTGYTQINPEYL